MKIVKTAKLKILTHTKTFDETIEVYNSALSFYIFVCEEEYNVPLCQDHLIKHSYFINL